MTADTSPALPPVPCLTAAGAVRRSDGTLLTESEVQERHRQFLAAATADNTRRSYRSAIRHFYAWGGVLPCDTALVTRYLLNYAASLSPGTLALRLTALSQWHRFQGFADPTDHPELRRMLRGIGRTHGKPKKKARALPLEDLERMVAALSQQPGLAALRNSALLQLAFFGAFRRSEVVGLQLQDLAWEPAGLAITLVRSKTDQQGQGITCAIPYGAASGICCPATALKRWLQAAGISAGPVFRRITRWDRIGDEALYAGSVNAILAACAEAIGLPYAPELSSHSFRRGLATSAHRAGANFIDIKRQGGWRHDGTVQGYIEEADQFRHNAAGNLLKPES
ncbi:tyrosine-type recombinase/integrase [Herminiimonas sp. CN]|uniref:tyrosine-type recombinase/integrase n=1 Tax=Herminiimonas sp. CN TaxID=1349818 RepID=UPI0009DDF304|nr:tyrosine-type recombinase/integrase [Herminiimonas sp. CN]